MAEKGQENPETDWDGTPGEPRRVIPVHFGVFWPKKAGKTPLLGFLAEKGWENPETDWDDKPGKPRRVIPVRFGFFLAEKGQENPEADCDDKPGKPRRVTSRFFGRKGPGKNRNGLGRVMPVGFGVFWPKRARKTRKRTGMTSLGTPGVSSHSFSGFLGQKGPGKPRNGLG